MKKLLLAFLIVLVMFSSPAYTARVEAEAKSISNTFYDTYLDFSISSFQEIYIDENILYSPVSLYYVVAMMSVFSSEDTYLEFETLLGTDKETLLTQIPLLTNDIAIDPREASFWFANFLYYDNQTNLGTNEYIFNETILNQYQDVFDYDLQDITFYDGSAGQRLAQEINDGTNGYLNLSEEDLLYIRTANILFNNTIYYNGVWRVEFDEDDNFEDEFFINDEASVTVEYMQKVDDQSAFYETETSKSLKTYFTDGSSMIYILPQEGTSISELMNNSDAIKDILEKSIYFSPAETTLTIPKLSFENTITLKDSLENLGLTSPFTESDETFPSLTSEPFIVTDVRQVAKIRIDEVGVEVVASTTSIGCTATAPRPPYTFTVDRPFAYIIMSSTNIPLFIGVTTTL